ncbi:MAG: hypothetical protein PHO61_01470 [Candidatus ainarchaeum sp.]|jgi:hypothetical protein|nr:hypothetical protein [Candidatus ainarchaeum sp.]
MIMKKIKKINQKDYLKDALVFTKENKGFMISFLILLCSILFLQLNVGQSGVFEEKANYAINMYYTNQSEIDAYLIAINEELSVVQEELDEYFLISAKDDFIWLKEKEVTLFNSKPVNDIYAKEAAFSTFLLKMIELNEACSVRIGEPEYEYTIQLAENNNQIPIIFSQSKVIELFEGDVREANIFSNTLNQLFLDYLEFKQKSMQENTDVKAKYVNAKKIILLSELS